VFDALGVQVPEEIDQPVPLSQTGVEAVLEWRELPPVGRLVGGLQHVEVTEQQERRVGGRGVEGARNRSIQVLFRSVLSSVASWEGT
jgi:hypothetical protein